MTKNEIKKDLYKRKPQAHLQAITKTHLYYNSWVGDRESQWETIDFYIPIEDLGDAKFYAEMDAKLLIKWLVTKEEVEEN